MTINGIEIHEWAIEQVATRLMMAAVAVRDEVEHGAAVMCAAVYFAELYGQAAGL
jgi:hypothetical protein